MFNSRVRLTLIAIALVASMFTIFFARRQPQPDPAVVDSKVTVEPEIVLFSPNRDKGPETAALRVLEQMDSDGCFALLETLIPEGAHRVCEYERQFPDSKFTLIIRRDNGEKSSLLYVSSRKEYPGRYQVNVVRQGAEWNVETLSAKY